jgi:CHASE3 domain sensor protein
MRHGISLERKILLAFLAGGAILLGAGWFAVSSGRAYLTGDALTDRLHDAQRALLALELSLREAESGARGYLLTGKQEYLRPYERASGEIDRQTALDLSGLIAAADEAMYTAKRAGRNRIAFYATAVATSDSTAPAVPAA